LEKKKTPNYRSLGYLNQCVSYPRGHFVLKRCEPLVLTFCPLHGNGQMVQYVQLQELQVMEGRNSVLENTQKTTRVPATDNSVIQMIINFCQVKASSLLSKISRSNTHHYYI
jgi:hypothetical protein